MVFPALVDINGVLTTKDEPIKIQLAKDRM